MSENQAGDENGTNYKAQDERRSGVAQVKSEFILNDYKPELALEFVADDVKEKLLAAAVGNEGETESPPAKRAKVKGQNKGRPRCRSGQPLSTSRLCTYVVTGGECPFGDKCIYSHNVVSFVEERLPSLKGGCYVFDQYGRCPYGLKCDYGRDHIKQVNGTYVSVVKEEAAAISLPNQLNLLKKDVQSKLRKKTFDFGRAVQALAATGALLKQQPGDAGRAAAAPASSDSKSRPTSMASLTVALTGADDETTEPRKCSLSPTRECEVAPSTIHGAVTVESAKPRLATDDAAVLATTKGNQPEANLIADAATKSEPILNTCDFPTAASAAEELHRSAADRITAVDVAVCQPVVGSQVLDTSQQVARNKNGAVDCVHPFRKTCGVVTDDDLIKCRPSEKQRVDFTNKLYLAPLTTVGNLPFRRICKRLGADITCGEMAMATNILQCQSSEWALLRRHPSEDLFGVQLCGAFADTMTKCAQLIEDTCEVDFIDINVGCPIDLVCSKGAGSALLRRRHRLEEITRSMSSVMTAPLTIKIRTGLCQNEYTAHTLVPHLRDWGVSLVTLHGRTKEQRYTKLADWNYIAECAKAASPLPLFGNGDVLSYEDYYQHMDTSGVSGIMLARGALIKPWLFTEIKERRHWDISSAERFDIFKDFVNFGLEHWGSDSQGVETTRRFLLEWLSFTCRYIPVGLLEVLPQRINERPPYYRGRDDLETLLSSSSCASWIKISEMLLGPVPEGFVFLPKHKANAYG